MPLIPQSVDRTDRDFTALRLRMRNAIRSVFPEWTDFNVANFGNILTELFAHTGDLLSFYQDAQARQSRITTATQRRALLGLVKLVGFVPASATAATVDQTFTLDAVPTADVVISRGTPIYTEGITSPIRYTTLGDLTISAGANPPVGVVGASNSDERLDSFPSNGLPRQAASMTFMPYIDDTLVVIATDGAYSQVVSFLDSGPTDRHFTVAVDQTDHATVTFGDGVSGAIPVGVIDFAYRTGGGSGGRVERNKLRALGTANFTDANGAPQRVTTTNVEPSSGGNDRQTVQQIRERAPLTARVLKRSVAREDFVINARRLPDVARALFLTSNEDRSVGENRGELYIVPVGGGRPSTALKAAVLAQVTTVFPRTVTFAVSVRDAPYRAVDVFAVVYFRGQSEAQRAATSALIRTNLALFFQPQNADGTDNATVDFGANLIDADGNIEAALALSDIENVVRDTPGVRKIGASAGDFALNGERDDVFLGYREFPVLGTVTIRDGDTGAVR